MTLLEKAGAWLLVAFLLLFRGEPVAPFPAAAQRLDEEHRGDEALADELRGEALGVEELLLRDDDLERARHTALVARVDEIERAAGALHGDVRLLRSALERGEADHAVLRLLHRREHHAPGAGDGHLVG